MSRISPNDQLIIDKGFAKVAKNILNSLQEQEIDDKSAVVGIIDLGRIILAFLNAGRSGPSASVTPAQVWSYLYFCTAEGVAVPARQGGKSLGEAPKNALQKAMNEADSLVNQFAIQAIQASRQEIYQQDQRIDALIQELSSSVTDLARASVNYVYDEVQRQRAFRETPKPGKEYVDLWRETFKNSSVSEEQFTEVADKLEVMLAVENVYRIEDAQKSRKAGRTERKQRIA